MIEVAEENKEVLAPLFQKLHDSLILSCIQNYFGTAWVDMLPVPAAGRIIVGGYCFLAGEPSEEFLYSSTGKLLGGLILIPDSAGWRRVIEEAYGSHCQKKERYGIKKEGDIFDRALLRQYADSLPEGYELKHIDEKIYHQLMSAEWSMEFCCQFQNWEHYRDKGLGVVVCHGDEVVAGASSYASYREGIEIVIATRQDYRRRGLALVCGSELVLSALERNLYPNWDAANMASVGIATKLGYHYDKPYTAYELSCPPLPDDETAGQSGRPRLL